jgi:hypothetical protein
MSVGTRAADRRRGRSLPPHPLPPLGRLDRRERLDDHRPAGPSGAPPVIELGRRQLQITIGLLTDATRFPLMVEAFEDKPRRDHHDHAAAPSGVQQDRAQFLDRARVDQSSDGRMADVLIDLDYELVGAR